MLANLMEAWEPSYSELEKYYSKYFEELYNPIFENDVDYFKYNGILFKPYTIAKK